MKVIISAIKDNKCYLISNENEYIKVIQNRWLEFKNFNYISQGGIIFDTGLNVTEFDSKYTKLFFILTALNNL